MLSWNDLVWSTATIDWSKGKIKYDRLLQICDHIFVKYLCIWWLFANIPKQISLIADYGALFRPTLSGSGVLSHSFNDFEEATKSSFNDFSWVSLTFYESNPTIFHTECSPPIHSMTSPRPLNAPILPARLPRSSGYTWETLRALRGRYEVHPNKNPLHSMNS